MSQLFFWRLWLSCSITLLFCLPFPLPVSLLLFPSFACRPGLSVSPVTSLSVHPDDVISVSFRFCQFLALYLWNCLVTPCVCPRSCHVGVCMCVSVSGWVCVSLYGHLRLSVCMCCLSVCLFPACLARSSLSRSVRVQPLSIELCSFLPFFDYS